MHMLNNFINIFQVLYRGFTCIIKSVQSVFTIKTFCMQKHNVKTFMCFCIMSEKNVRNLLKIYCNECFFLLTTS